MGKLVSKTPFLRLLIAAVTAIIAAAYLHVFPHPVILFVAGVLICTISYLLPIKQRYSLRWIFGSGLFISVFALFTFLYQLKTKESEFTFSEEKVSYIGIIEDMPQEKQRSFACDVKVHHPVQKRVVLYFQKDESASALMPGQEIVFQTTMRPFNNFGNPDDFNYVRFMENKGFSGTAFVSASDWMTTEHTVPGIKTSAVKIRQNALELFKEFRLDHDAYAFVSALTLGYKQDLSDDLKEAFRASGTSHVLAVSGLHVGIVYIVIVFFFSFFSKRGKMLILRQMLIIAALWMYALLTGMSPSVIRATIMLTIISFGVAINKRGMTYNTLAATAFLLLAYNPMYLFDVGFQMSFGAVLSILFFNPKINSLYTPKRKIVKYIWGLFTVSTSAQLGVFPISLYYFGTFPTYFFIANMIVVPLIGLIIYATLPMIVIVLLKKSSFVLIDHFFKFFQWILKTLINIVLRTVYWIESIPLAQITDGHISILQLMLLILITVALFKFFEQKQSKPLIILLSSLLLLLSLPLVHNNSGSSGMLVVFNTPNVSDIGIFDNNKRAYFRFEQNGFLPVNETKALVLSENIYHNHASKNRLKIDVLILSQDKSFSIPALADLFDFKTAVFDNSVPQNVRNRWLKECLRLNINAHDVSQHGAFVINL